VARRRLDRLRTHQVAARPFQPCRSSGPPAVQPAGVVGGWSGLPGIAQVLTAVWGYDDYDPNLVEVHVSALRRKLGAPRLLHTARGLGYMLRAEP
jgi:hypothetical protein